MKTIKILLIPFVIIYSFCITLPLLPLIYGKNKFGTLLFIPIWLLHFILLPLMFIKHVELFTEKLNRLSNKVMGYDNGRTVSCTVGERIDAGKGTFIEVFHCRILATYDGRGYHCSENCKSLL